ncbi:hypothetical protein [Paenibacillus roseipurpureus]|uniref:Lipoprotein n=1 Tax=Paenibacillus roseopurpureus TaxID=2918901 RepID=A0AA96LQH4_9BACL|nr:hypothetical protein [Paenibacillus sp. MBLB1832]WNR44154.1 hypothetical protein MJB10_24155 [Paenibacillus sp. MBLB1832]
MNTLRGASAVKVLYVTVAVSLMIGLSGCRPAEPTLVVEENKVEKATVTPVAVKTSKGSVAPSPAVSPKPILSGAKELGDLVPAGWQPLVRNDRPEKAEGDLNKDGIPDVAMVIEQKGSKQGEAPQRALLIAFGNGEGTYTPSIIAKQAILRADEGGIWGDPLTEIGIDRGSVVVSFYGGSNERWYANYRFRFQNDDWYLIGATLGSFFTGTMTEETGNEEDYNLLTGDYVKRIVDDPNADKPTTHTVKGNMGKRELLKLGDFVATESKYQFLSP